MKTMLSKYPGTCASCSNSFKKGELIAWSRASGARHPKCAGIYIPQSPQDMRAPCWICGDTSGKFRNYGAATPVYCDQCHAAKPPAKRQATAPDFSDLAYEDQCAAACGFGL